MAIRTLLLSMLVCGVAEAAPPHDVAGCFRHVASQLASDGYEGRGPDTVGVEAAAQRIEGWFREAGLEDGGIGYSQLFPIRYEPRSVFRPDDDAWTASIEATLSEVAGAARGAVPGLVSLPPAVPMLRNVIGVLPGIGALAGEVVVVGAHYDHEGYGHGLSRGRDRIHNGADDNASGVAGVICAVIRLDRSALSRRTLVVVAFGGEELGLLGSTHYAEHPMFPLGSTVAMINLDMVGRLRDGQLTLTGIEDAVLRSWFEAPAAELGLVLGWEDDGGRSDQHSFIIRGVPAVHLFTGMHPEYHTPADDAQTLYFAGGGRIALLTAAVLDAALAEPEVPGRVPPGSTIRAWRDRR